MLRRKYTINAAIVLLMAALLTSCSSHKEAPAISSSRSSRNDVKRDRPIKAMLEQADDVNEAAVVITGNTAIIGIKLKSEPDESETLAIKRRIEREVKAADNGIDHVAISTSPQLFNKIASYSDK